MSTKVELAAALAKHFHAGQKYGEYDYFAYHLCEVVGLVYTNYHSNLPFTLEDAVCVAYLHDSVEDTTLDDGAIFMLFGHIIHEAVYHITKEKGCTRKEYLFDVKRNALATFVKICDAEFNRYNCLVDGNEKRAKYYQDTIDYLKGEN